MALRLLFLLPDSGVAPRLMAATRARRFSDIHDFRLEPDHGEDAELISNILRSFNDLLQWLLGYTKHFVRLMREMTEEMQVLRSLDHMVRDIGACHITRPQRGGIPPQESSQQQTVQEVPLILAGLHPKSF